MKKMSSKNVELQHPQTFEQPLCAEVSPSFFYLDDDDDDTVPLHARNNSYQTAIDVCSKCEHISACGEWGVRREKWGIWGGLTPNQRAQIRRKRKITLNEPQ